ncbi:MAG: glycosyltransferase family 4 protein, partial [Planctomycetes bacterium]|nr:glycosyltransferase family 4 protein [Planctomycetota bacterium]
PVVISVHDMFALRMPQLCTVANRSHASRNMPESIRRAARIVVPSEWVKLELLEWNQGLEEKIDDLEEKTAVIPWGVDSRFAPVTDSKRLEEVQLKYGLPPKFILFVGRIEPKKNVTRIIQAYFAATAANGLDHRLVLVGPKGWGAVREVETMITELGLKDKVVRPGFIPDEDLPAVYSLASAAMFPSFAEGFGFPLLEAQACGTPVIASNIPSLEEISGAAKPVKPDDLPTMRVALEEVLMNDNESGKMREAGLTHASAFTWKAHAEKTFALYEQVINEDRNR